MSQASFQKQQREKAKREKASAKRERRAAKAEEQSAEPGPDERVSSGQSAPAIFAELDALHERFDAGILDFEDFEARKRELLSQLEI